MSIALILNTYITCHFSIWIFESFISGSHSPLYPFSVLLWQAWGAYDGTCLLSSSSAHSGQCLGAGGWGHLSLAWVSCDHRWGQRPILLAFPHPHISLSSPFTAFLFLESTVIQYFLSLLHLPLWFSLHFFSVFGCTVCLAWLVDRPVNEPRPLAVKAQSPNHWTARKLSSVKFFFFPLQLLISEMCSPQLMLWCQTIVTIVRFCYCTFPLMISGETVSILLSFRQDQNSVFKCTE